MAFKTNIIDKCKQEVEFDIPYVELIPHFEKAYQKYKNKVNIPGFRKGKAPTSLIKKMYGEMIEQASLEDISNDVFKDYLKTNDIHNLGEGLLTDLDYNPGQAFKFKVKYEVKPEIESLSYKDMEITKPVYKIDEKMIEGEIDYLRSKHATYENSEKATDDDYVVTLDVQKLDDNGFSIIGESEKNVKFYLNDTHLNYELKSQLLNIASGEEKILTVRTEGKEKPEKYKAKTTKIEKIILPELNPEFFEKVYKHKIEDETHFREHINSDLENMYKNISEQELKNNIINELIKLNDVPVPDALVENVLNSYVDDIRNQNPKRELPANFNEEEFRKTRRVDAIVQVKWFLIRDKIIELEKIEVTDADITPLVEADASRYNLPVEKIKKLYDNNPDVKFKILDKKVIDYLITNSKIKEVVQSQESKITT
jgi:trigger factor